MTALSPTVALLKLKEVFSLTPVPQYWRQGLKEEDVRAVEAAVAPALGELEALRRDTIKEIDLRGFILVPLGIAGGLLWGYLNSKAQNMLSYLVHGGIGAMVGCGWAFYGPERRYRSAYKSRIVPHLAARFGDLTYRAVRKKLDLSRLCKLGLLPSFGRSRIEDEIIGSYRGVGISMLEANLETGGKNSSVVFNGLVVALSFPGRFSGTTVVTKDPGRWLSAAADLFGPSGLERVRLEDPRFEERYQVYGSDQIGARALLTPAIMGRIMELESHAPADPPRILAEPGTFWFTIPKHKTENLFEPPPLSQPVDAGAGEMLTELSRDLGSVLAFVDTVLELDPLNAPQAQA